VANNGGEQPWQGINGIRRREIYDRLQLVGVTAAAFWHDACLTLSLADNFDVPTHLIGHALREIDGILLAVLLPETTVLPAKFTRAAKVNAIAEMLELEHEVADFWRGLELQEVTHRRMPFPRADDDQFRAMFDRYSAMLEIVSFQFERRFDAWLGRLDHYVAIEIPTEADVTRLRQAVPWSSITLLYFFDKLTSSHWLKPLTESGFFDSLPAVEQDQTSNAPRFQQWPQAAYLKRVAKLDGGTVSQLVSNLPPSSNPWVTTALVEIANLLPPDSCTAVHERLCNAVRGTYGLQMSLGSIERLVAKYVRNGHVSQAMDLTREVLWIDVDTSDADANESESADAKQPVTRLSRTGYSDAVRGLANALVDLKPQQTTIELFCDLLAIALTSALPGSRVIPHDHSNIWRRSIGGEPTGPYEECQALVSVVRDLASRAASDDFSVWNAMLQYLINRDWHVFRRIALHVATGDFQTAAMLLMNRSLFETFDTEKEYVQLLQAHFSALPKSDQNMLLEWIDEGPSPSSGQHASTDDPRGAVTRTERWRLNRLQPIHAHLDEQRSAEFIALRERHGTPDSNIDEPQVVSWQGTCSPLDPSEIAAMEQGELFDYLESWTPSGSWSFNSPTRAGLGDAIAQAVAQDPVHFAALMREVVRFDPTYVHAVIEGANLAMRGGRELPWESVLQLIDAVLAFQPELDNDVNDVDDDPFTPDRSLAWARRAITKLLETAIRSSTSGLAVSHRFDVFAAMESLVHDPDPSTSRTEDAEPNDPLMMIALNSVRGRALGLVVHYLVWLHQANTFGSIVDCPEVQALVAERLDLETSPAVLSQLGRHFTQLAALDFDWARALAAPLFGGIHAAQGRHDAWCAYLAEQPALSTCDLLRDRYELHVARLDGAQAVSENEHHLVHHLMTMYWSGRIDLGDDSLLGRFFANAPSSLRGYAIQYIGHSLKRSPEGPDKLVADRIVELWDARRNHADGLLDSTIADEAQAFEWWFTADNLDPAWLLENLDWSLRRGPGPQHPYQLAKKLAVVAQRTPADLLAVLRCYQHLLSTVEVQMLGWSDDLFQVVASAIASATAEVVGTGRDIANVLVSRGHLRFRVLLA
jgi:hypothetical protein